MDKERVVDRINKENRELYGDTCSKCSMYYHYCRCEPVLEFIDISKVDSIMKTEELTVKEIIERYGDNLTEEQLKALNKDEQKDHH